MPPPIPGKPNALTISRLDLLGAEYAISRTASRTVNTRHHAFIKVSSDKNTASRPQYSFELLYAMTRTKGQIRQLFKSLSFPTAHARSTATTMNHSQPFEEERLPWYRADQFYPVHVGETFISRYEVVGKLGYGAYSTVWLCRDMKSRNPPRTILTKNAD